MGYEFKVGDTGKTRAGLPYRVIAVDLDGKYPIAAAVRGPEGEHLTAHVACGNWMSNEETHSRDLLPPAPATRQIKRWLVAWQVQYSKDKAVTNYREEEYAEAVRMATGPISLMPDGKPQLVTMEILEKPRQA